MKGTHFNMKCSAVQLTFRSLYCIQDTGSFSSNCSTCFSQDSLTYITLGPTEEFQYSSALFWRHLLHLWYVYHHSFHPLNSGIKRKGSSVQIFLDMHSCHKGVMICECVCSPSNDVWTDCHFCATHYKCSVTWMFIKHHISVICDEVSMSFWQKSISSKFTIPILIHNCMKK
jgi:hypothetical protein